MNNEVIKGLEARKIITNTVMDFCDSVSVTLGPKGRNALIAPDCTDPFITNDGVTIASSIEYDGAANVIANIIKETSIKTCEKVGDGTTTSLVLLNSIYKESLKQMEKGVSPYIIINSLQKEVDEVCKYLMKNSIKTEYKDIERIATVSSGDGLIGSIIKEAYESVGENGIIFIEETKNEETSLKIENGMVLNSGVSSSYMIKEREKEEIIDNPLYLITDKRIEYLSELECVINIIKKEKKNLIIIADDFSEEVIEGVVINKTNNLLNIVCITAPNYSEKKIDILEDICIYTGSTLISSKYNKNLENVALKDLGVSLSSKITNDKTIIYGSMEEKNIDKRKETIKKKINECEDSFDKEVLESRLASLSCGIAYIYAGGKTHAEMILNKMKIEDAVESSKVALKYGYSKGGGLELYNISQILNSNTLGDAILKVSLKEPMKQIIRNCGLDEVSIIKELKNKNSNIGYDASSGKIVDMTSCGIIDSTRVLIEALKNALSIAGVLLTTDLIVVNKSKKEINNLTQVL